MSAAAFTTEMLIMGMRSNQCRERLVEVLESVDGVWDVSVNLHRSHAVVTHDDRCSSEKLVSAIARAGYGATVVK